MVTFREVKKCAKFHASIIKCTIVANNVTYLLDYPIQQVVQFSRNILLNFKSVKIHFYHHFSEFWRLLYWMSPDHILKLVGWPQARLGNIVEHFCGG